MTTNRRIASLISSGTEMLYGLGLGGNVVAVSHECDHPPELASKPRVTYSNVDSQAASGQIDDQVQRLSAAGDALYEIDRRKLRDLRPDVIVTQAQCDVCAVRYRDVMEFVQQELALARTRVISLNPQSLEDVFGDILRLGHALDVPERAEVFVRESRERIHAIRRRTAAITHENRPRVICIEWIEPLMLAANWTPELIDIAGGSFPLTERGAHSTYAAWDEVVAFDPEVVVVAPCGFDLQRTIRESAVMASWPQFDSLSAVRNGRVYAVDGNAYLNRSGPRLVESAEILARLIHPELFAGTPARPEDEPSVASLL